MADLESEVRKRRTFAIISHPDAGKTTITERILFHGGVIQEVGDVKGKSGTKAATSDWMKMEQERGVSITSSVMRLDYNGLRVNLLDTPGHKDFSEDTYRTLMVADSAAMLIDSAKGVETQTRKLYEVCRLRKIPIFTFANKMDRPGKSGLELIDDVENTLKMSCWPVTWPIGGGDRFKGLYHRLEKRLYLFTFGKVEPKIVDVPGGWEEIPFETFVSEHDMDIAQTFRDEMTLMEGVLGPFDRQKFLDGDLSLMTFGSAKSDWGVDIFLNLFTEHAPSPQPRKAEQGVVSPLDPEFSGFVFKIQANMDKKHRDRVAFIRVCSGKFDRGMKVNHVRLGREIRLAYASQLMAGERNTVDEAFPGDIVGITDNGNFRIGDSVSTGKPWVFGDIPRFAPEHFGRLTIKDPIKKKQLEKGIKQLVDEGSVQLFCDPGVGWQEPILGVVGVLQFEVMLYRLADEYGLEAKLERMPYSLARWPRSKENGQPVKTGIMGVSRMFGDLENRPVALFESEWKLNWAQKENPTVEFHIAGS